MVREQGLAVAGNRLSAIVLARNYYPGTKCKMVSNVYARACPGMSVL